MCHVQHGAEKDLQDSNGYTPLFRACEKGHTEVTMVLIHAGAQVMLQVNIIGQLSILQTFQYWFKESMIGLNLETVTKISSLGPIVSYI